MAAAAEQYSIGSSLQKQDGLKLIELIQPKEKSRVLDLGCGTGYLSSVLAETVGPGGEVIAVDPDKERIKTAGEKYGGKNITFLEGSSDNFPASQYDVVFSNYVLQWIKNKKCTFDAVYQNLSPGGCFAFIAVAEQPVILLQLCDLMGPAKAKQMNEKFEFVPSEVYETLAKECGFLVKFKDATPTNLAFPNTKLLMDWWFATTHGAFDPALVDEVTLESFTKHYEGKPVELEVPIVTFLLTKSC